MWWPLTVPFQLAQGGYSVGLLSAFHFSYSIYYYYYYT